MKRYLIIFVIIAAFLSAGWGGHWAYQNWVRSGNDISYSLGNMTVDTNTLHVDATNNRVGIGTTSPEAKLHISGRAYITHGGSTLIGYEAGMSDDGTTNNNTIIGYEAYRSAVGAQFNSGVGHRVLFSVSTGNGNSGLGYLCLGNITSGTYNIGIGYQAGRFLANGSTAAQQMTNSIYIGYNSEASATDVTNEIVIGYAAEGAGSNTARIGGSAITHVYLTGHTVRSVTAGITAGTTQSQGQIPLTSDINEISTCANANDVVTLPTAIAGMEITIINNGAQTLQIFPASSDNLGAGVDTSTTLAAGANVTFVSYDATNWEVK